MLLFSCSQILSRYIYNTVCINIESNLNLRNASSCRRNSVQTELSQSLVVSCELSLALYDMNVYGSLVICCCGENLALLSRNSRISLNQLKQRTHPGLKSCLVPGLSAVLPSPEQPAYVWNRRLTEPCLTQKL